jgi:O-antigen ligase
MRTAWDGDTSIGVEGHLVAAFGARHALPVRQDLRSVVCVALVAAIVVALTCVERPAGAWIWGVVELALLWFVGVGLMVVRRTDLRRLDAVALLAFATLIAWTGLSALWSLDPGQSAVAAQQRLVGFAVLAVVVLAARRPDASAILGGVLAGCTVVCVLALIGSVTDGEPLHPPLSWPVGYSNALGIIAGMGTLLALALATREGSPRGVRRLEAATVPLMAITLVLTGSFGAVAATVVGLVVLVALLPRHRTALAGVVMLAVVALVVSAVVSERGAHHSRSALLGGISVSARLSLWNVALRSVSDSPIVGTGAGSFERLWLRERRARSRAYSAHNVYLETLAELGVVGFCLMVVMLAAPLVSLLREVDPEAIGGMAAYAAFLVHAGVDVDWHLPGVSVTGVLCGAGVLLAARPHGSGRALRLPTRLAALAVVAGLGGFAFAGFMSATAMSRSEEAAVHWSFDAAMVEARSAARWAPWSGEPWQALGRVALASGELGRARASFRRGVSIDPADTELWRGLARTTRGAARRLAASRAAALNPLAQGRIEATRETEPGDDRSHGQ